MSVVCLKLICVPSHLRIKSKINTTVYEALCDLTAAWLSHLISYHSLPLCNNLSTLALLHLIMIYPHWLSCFFPTGPPCTDVQVVHCITLGGAFGRLQGAWWTRKCTAWWSSSHTPRFRHLLVLLPGTSIRFFAQLAPSCHPFNKYSTKHYSLQAELVT